MRAIVENHREWNDYEQRQRVLVYFDSASVIEVDGSAIGLWKVVRGGGEIQLCQVQVLPSCQRRGIATSLFKGLTDEADRLGKTISLRVYRSNPAVSFYRRIGFVVRSESSDAFEMAYRGKEVLIPG